MPRTKTLKAIQRNKRSDSMYFHSPVRGKKEPHAGIPQAKIFGENGSAKSDRLEEGESYREAKPTEEKSEN